MVLVGSWWCVPAGVHVVLSYGASKEALAAIAARGPVVFPCCFVSTDCAVTAQPVWTGVALLGRHDLWNTKTNSPVNERASSNGFSSRVYYGTHKKIFKKNNLTKGSLVQKHLKIYIFSTTVHLTLELILVICIMPLFYEKLNLSTSSLMTLF